MSAARLRGRELDARLRAVGIKVPPRGHRTRLVRYGDRYASATIPCGDARCRFCNPPRRLTR